MFEGLKTMDNLVSNESERFVEEWKNNIEKWEDRVDDNKEQIETLPRSEIKQATRPVPPTINQTIVINPEEIDLNERWKSLHKKSLFKLSWGIRGNSDVEAVIDQEKLLEEWKKRVVDDNLFEPKAVYGYFKCRCDDNNLVVENLDGEKLIFDFKTKFSKERSALIEYIAFIKAKYYWSINNSKFARDCIRPYMMKRPKLFILFILSYESFSVIISTLIKEIVRVMESA